MPFDDAGEDCEVAALLEDIYQHYNHDFRDYSRLSLQRRLGRALRKLGLRDTAQLRGHIAGNAIGSVQLLQYLTVPVSSMFRDPAYFSALRNEVVPLLRTYASPKIWVAGCCAGEEAYSIAILLREEGLLERCVIYATDINAEALARAERGIFPAENIRIYTENYQKAGGTTTFSDYYHAAYGHAVFDRELRRNIIFAEHSLTTDSAFSEVHLVSCRNVLIYFNRALQERVLELFHASLCRRGFLGLGARETVEFTACGRYFDNYVRSARIYRKNDESFAA